jgi:UDP-glucuronate 4-epimerase
MDYSFQKPLLVTGGAGFIGSHLIDRLLQEGNTVVCLDNLNDFYNPGIKRLNQKHHFDYDRFSFVEGDIRDQDTLIRIFKQHEFGHVIHLAAMAGVRPSVENPSLYTDVNIRGTQTLLEVIKNHPVEKLIFASSSSLYGNNKKTPFSEDDNVDQQVSPYGATKKMGEILCFTYHYLTGIPTTCLRFFTVYGPRQRPEMAIHKFIRLAKNGDPIPVFGDGSSARDYTYIDDIIIGILNALIAEDQFIIYNLGNSEPVKLSDLLNIIHHATKLEIQTKRHPFQLGDVEQTFADVSRASRRLDYHPQTHIEEGINAFVKWYDQMSETYPELYR